MRVLARMLSTSLAVAALAAPSAAWGQAPDGSPAPHKHRWLSMGSRRHCVECQRARAFKDGVIVPAPPAPVVAHGGNHSNCATCGTQGGAVVMNQVPMQGQGVVIHEGPVMAGATPGYVTMDGGQGTVVMGPDASTMGLTPGQFPGMAPPSVPGSHDSSVRVSSFNPLKTPETEGPKVLSHLFGFSEWGRDRRDRRERRKEEAHASIPYGAETAPVNDLPARMVYGR